MRDYGTVSPQFWIGTTGKALRGNLEAQVVALYLMTSPHANMIGVFYCPVDYIAKETGLPYEGASKGLRSLVEAGFCRFDDVTEEVFVMRMAAFQIGEQLEAKDNRCKGAARELEKVSSDSLRQGFRAHYCIAFHLPVPTPAPAPAPAATASPLEAPSKPETGAEAGTRAEAEKKKPRKRASPEVPQPEDVTPQTWTDWTQLRRDKRATVSETVIAEARLEAGKAHLSLERFLTIWCLRGSQGLQADWLKPSERGSPNGAEPEWRAEQRQRTQQAAPGVAAGKPAADFFIDVEAKNVTTDSLDRPDLRQADPDLRPAIPEALGRH